MPLFQCAICTAKRPLFQALCKDCQILFATVQKNLGLMGLGQLIDTLIATGISKPKIKNFLEADQKGQGSVLDQITARLTNNLAEGIGVKQADMKAQDVRKIRINPTSSASTKPIDQRYEPQGKPWTQDSAASSRVSDHHISSPEPTSEGDQ